MSYTCEQTYSTVLRLCCFRVCIDTILYTLLSKEGQLCAEKMFPQKNMWKYLSIIAELLLFPPFVHFNSTVCALVYAFWRTIYRASCNYNIHSLSFRNHYQLMADGSRRRIRDQMSCNVNAKSGRPARSRSTWYCR